MRILVTGAGGRVGTQVCRELAQSHQLRMLDIRPPDPTLGEPIEGSVADWDTVAGAVADMEAVVHLAIHNPAERRRQTQEAYIQDDIDVGVKGTDMLLHAAVEGGIGRVVYTSSLNVYSARYPEAGEFLRDEDEALSAEHYGTVKWLAEELCRHYALAQGLSVAVLRLNSVTFPATWREQGKDLDHHGYACTRVHIEDVQRAVRLAVEREGVTWGRCLISGANPERRFDTDTAEAVIGFRARYGFEAGRMYRDGEIIEA